MKKLINLIVIMTFLTSFAIANNQNALELANVTPDETEYTVSNTERIVDKYVDKIGGVIEALAQKLEVPAEKVYATVVKQQAVNSIANIIAYIFLSVVGTILLYIGVKNIDDCEDASVAPILIGSIMLLVVIIILPLTLQDTVTGFANPEYGALKDIMNMITGKGC